MEEDLISVIVPAYNSSTTINRCIDSIIKQTYNNLEIIIINDGSKDNTLDIIKKYKDKRIIVVNIENAGVSNARNIGMNKAGGKYIVFVDSDDYIHETMIEKLYNNIYEKDLVICKKNIIKNSIVEKENCSEFSNYINDLESNELFQIYNANLLNPPYCKIYKKDILLENNILFDTNISYGEDLIFNIKYLDKIRKIRIINEYLYFYDMDYSTLTNRTYFNIMDIKENIIVELNKYYMNKFNTKKNKELEKIKLDIMTSSTKNFLRVFWKYQSIKWKEVFKIDVDLFTNSEMNMVIKKILKYRCFVLYSIILKMEKKWKKK